MTRALTLLLVSLITLTFTAAASAQDDASRMPDPRLDNIFSLSESRITVDELLRKASAESGVPMQASTQQRYWNVREMPVSVHVKDITVRDFQQQLAQLLDFSWSRTGEPGRWGYTLWQGANARDREARARMQKEQEVQSKIASSWQSTAEELRRLQGMSQDEIEQESKDSPFLRFAALDPLGRSYAQIIAGLAPYAFNDIAVGQNFQVPFAQLAPQLQNSVQGFSGNIGSLMSRMSNRDMGNDDGVNWSEVTVNIRPVPSGASHFGLEQMGVLGMMDISGGGIRIGRGFPILDPHSPLAGLIAQGVSRVNMGEDIRSVAGQIGQQMQEIIQQGFRTTTSTEEVQEEEVDPRLLQEVDITAEEIEREDDAGSVLADLTEQAGINVFAEAWRIPGATVNQQKGTVTQVLDRTTARFLSNWEFDDGNVRIKAQNWAVRRASMVPKADIQYWADLAADQGSLTLDNLAYMVDIYTTDQLMEIMMQEESLGGFLWPTVTPERRNPLKFYGSLDEAARHAVLSENGLYVAYLTPQQSELLVPVLRSANVDHRDFFVPGSSLRIVKEENGASRIVLDYPPEETASVPLTRETPRPREQQNTEESPN